MRAAQACLAYRAEGGTRAVVLTNRPKLAMETLFEEAIPESVRYGTTFVFRQAGAPRRAPRPPLPGV